MFSPRYDVLCASITEHTTTNGIYLFYTIKTNPKGLTKLLGHGKRKTQCADVFDFIDVSVL